MLRKRGVEETLDEYIDFLFSKLKDINKEIDRMSARRTHEVDEQLEIEIEAMLSEADYLRYLTEHFTTVQNEARRGNIKI